MQEQKKIPSSGSHRGKNLGAAQKEGPGRELAAQRDTHARIFLLQESPVHQLRVNEVSEEEFARGINRESRNEHARIYSTGMNNAKLYFLPFSRVAV